jgi:O-antigen/teichoic acid export membrane protein
MQIANVINNSAWLLFEKGFRLVSVFIVNAYIARYLGPDQYGVLAYLLNLVALLWGITNLGADSIAVRELSITKNNQFLPTLFIARIASGTLLYGLSFFIIGNITGPEKINAYWAIAGLAIIIQAGEVIDLKYQSELKSKYTVKSKIIALVLSSILKIVLIKTEMPLIWFVIANFIEYALFISALTITYRASNKINIFEGASIEIGKKIITESWPVIISGVGTYLYWKSDILILNSIIGSSAVGLYSAATSLSQLATNIPTIIMISLLPYLSRMNRENSAEFNRLFGVILLYGWGLSIAIAILMFIFANKIVYAIYGDSFRKSIEIFEVHVFTLIPITIGIISSTWITINRKMHYLLLKAATGAIFCPVANIILIQKYGVMGAAWSALATLIIVDLLIVLVIDKRLFSAIFRMQNVSKSS